MNNLIDPLLDASHKGYPHHAPALRRSEIAAQGWNVLNGDLPLPLAVVRADSLNHNLGWMQGYANDSGVRFAPHGKTTMSPQLFQRQLDAGAWGLTFATVAQLRIGVQSGARNCVIANQVLNAGDLNGIRALLAQYADLRVLFLLDSMAQLTLIAATAPARPFEVLLELGTVGGRTGCRTADEAIALARAARASSAVSLAGIECYEGLGAKGDSTADVPFAQALMDRVTAIALQCEQEALFETDEIIVSAGGSAIFDLVVPALRPALRRPVIGLLRSGCYITHDHGFYKRMVSVVNQRLACGNGLQAALEVWATVQSLPEPGLAILAIGKRDISYDLDLPVPIAMCALKSRTPQPTPAGWTISGMNDQHAYLRLGDEPAALQVGDRVALGVSHPCTTFDKWRWMPVVDTDYRVIDALVTCF
ncbi:MAG: alanine racemase [Burkholderiaceae bacterium]|nr:alanine racemase [Burkholderiaceae bacterium]MBT9502155.1 alanine racemase [Burkholderiaceae bacterium]